MAAMLLLPIPPVGETETKTKGVEMYGRITSGSTTRGITKGIVEIVCSNIRIQQLLGIHETDIASEYFRENRSNIQNENEFVQGSVQNSDYKQTDLDMLAAIVHLESQGESDSGQQAVAQVVLNRVASSQFPNSVEGVIYQSGQFSPAGLVASTTPSQRCYDNAKLVYEGYRPIPENVLYFSIGKAAGKQPYVRIGNHWFCYG